MLVSELKIKANFDEVLGRSEAHLAFCSLAVGSLSWPVWEADHLAPCSAEVKNAWG
jgi:hypothetical protein